MKPVYYISHVLQGAESRYFTLEKHIFVILITARKLKPYFLSHHIIVHTNAPIRQLIHKLDVSGRMMRWALELSEYDISYTNLKIINDQALSDFVIECAIPSNKPIPLPDTHVPPLQDCWTMNVDGSATENNKGASLVFMSPKGTKFYYALKYTFPISNNESEYEALITGSILLNLYRFRTSW